MTTLPILPFPIRTVAAVSSFPCIYIAAPGQGAPLLPGVTGPQRAAMALQYAQITQSYQLLLNQDTGPNQTSIAITYPPAGPIEPLNSPNAKLLESIINSLVIAVGNLVTTLNAIVVTNAAAVAPPYSRSLSAVRHEQSGCAKPAQPLHASCNERAHPIESRLSGDRSCCGGTRRITC